MLKLGIDIGGTKIGLGLLGENNSLLAHSRLAVADIVSVGNDIKRATEALCESAGVLLSDIGSIGIGIPGTVSEDGRKILKAPNISLIGDDFTSVIEKALGVSVFLVQDSRAGALGEYVCGGGKGSKTLICFTLGTGIGTGIVIDGKIYNGGLGSAGELGHVPVIEDGRPCGCGKRGCLEKYCAGLGLEITAKELFGTDADSKLLFIKAKMGAPAAKTAIASAVNVLGQAIVSALNLLSPDCVLFSGGLSEEKSYLVPLIDYVKEHCYVSEALPKIAKAELGELSPLIGAALFPEYLAVRESNP